MLVLFLHGPLSVSRGILLMKVIRTCYNGVELGSFVGLFLVFTRALYELLAKRKKKLLFLDQQMYVLYYHELLICFTSQSFHISHQNFETNRLGCYYCIMGINDSHHLEKFLRACFSSAR